MSDDLRLGESDLRRFADRTARQFNARGWLPGQEAHEPELEDEPVSWTDPAYQRALAAEREAEAAEGAEDETPEEPEPFIPGALSSFAASAASALGYIPGEQQLTAQGAIFESSDEDTQDAWFERWLEGLTPEARAAAAGGDPEALAAFSDYIESSPDMRLASAAADLPGARLIEDPLHRPLRRFQR